MKHLICVSYTQQFATKRNMINIITDEFPNIKKATEEIEKITDCYVDNVVLVNWKEVPDNYNL